LTSFSFILEKILAMDVGAFTSSITCRLLGAGLGASLGWGIMIHDGIGLKFITCLLLLLQGNGT